MSNPGAKYNLTRHNVGKIFIEDFLKKRGYRSNQVYDGAIIETSNTIFMISGTYMNMSGKNLSKLGRKYRFDVK